MKDGHLERIRRAELESVRDEFHPGMRVLEIGGGSGFGTLLLQQKPLAPGLRREWVPDNAHSRLRSLSHWLCGFASFVDPAPEANRSVAGLLLFRFHGKNHTKQIVTLLSNILLRPHCLR